MRESLGVGILVALLQACVTPYGNSAAYRASRAADQAAAVGDWKTAEARYREARAADPSSSDLAKKHQRARANAIKAANARAWRCNEDADFRCAVDETSYVLELDPTNNYADGLRRKAMANLAATALRKARVAARAGRYREAFTVLAEARSHGRGDEFVEKVAELELQVARDALERARVLHKRSQTSPSSFDALEEALWLIERCAAVGVKDVELATTIRAQHASEAERRYLEAVAEADAALKARDWGRAVRGYRRAASYRTDTAASDSAAYAEAMELAEQARLARDFSTSAAALRKAVQTGRDLDGYAATELQKVEPKTYRIRLESILVHPFKPGTQTPWIGDADKTFLERGLEVGGEAVGYFGGKWVGAIAGPLGTRDSARKGAELGKKLMTFPKPNQPTLLARITTPDGRTFATKTRKGLYVVYGAEVVLSSNHYDRRPIRLHIVHDKKDGEEEDVAVVSLALGELITGEISTEQPAGLVGIVVDVNEDEGGLDGEVARLTELRGEGNLVNPLSSPSAAAKGYRLARVEANASSSDIGSDFDSEPDPYVVIKQSGKSVFKSRQVNDTRSGVWAPSSTYLFVRDDDDLTVDLYDKDPLETDHVFGRRIRGKDLAAGRVVVESGRGSSVVLEFEKRRVGPE